MSESYNFLSIKLFLKYALYFSIQELNPNFYFEQKLKERILIQYLLCTLCSILAPQKEYWPQFSLQLGLAIIILQTL